MSDTDRSWDHRLVVLENDWQREHCSGSRGRCLEKAIYGASYSYVTGMCGRTTRRFTTLCEKHAEQFAERHSLIIPQEAME